MIQDIAEILSTRSFILIWAGLVVVSTVSLLLDMILNNPRLPTLIRAIWFIAVIYSGPIGLTVYFTAGRKQIRQDTVLRKSLRSIAPTASGYAIGHTVAATITVGALSIPNWAVAVIGFPVAYLFAFSVIAIPLIRSGADPKQAFTDAFFSESAVVTVMEIVGTPTFLVFAADTTMADSRFWSSLVFSVIAGVALAAPFNFGLVRLGMKREPYDPVAPNPRSVWRESEDSGRAA